MTMPTLALFLATSWLGCDKLPDIPGVTGAKKTQPASDGGTDEAPAKKEESSGGGGAFGFLGGSDIDCDSTEGKGVEPTDGCVTAELSCGDKIVGHVEGGGENRYEGRFYQAKFCEARTDKYRGEERVYRFRMPEHQIANIELDSPCEDLDLFVMQWSQGSCPTMGASVGTCDASTKRGGGKIEMESITRERELLLVIEGKGGVTAPFGLEITCRSRN